MPTIQNDRITGAVPVALSDPGNPQVPTRIVLHYSAGSTLAGAVSTLRARGLSYHVLIDTDGSLHQTRPFNRTARHAGRSNWKAAGGLTNGASLNTASIGISLINLGGFGWFRDGRWYWGPPGAGVPSIADAQATKRASLYRLHIRSVAYAPPARGIVPGGSSRALSPWASVDIDGSNRHAGFVHMRYLTRTPLAPDYDRRLRA